VPEENNCFSIITQVNITETEIKAKLCTNLLTTSREKQQPVLSLELYSPRGKYSEIENKILNQSASGKLYIHLWSKLGVDGWVVTMQLSGRLIIRYSVISHVF
jgi:hypothetical protein